MTKKVMIILIVFGLLLLVVIALHVLSIFSSFTLFGLEEEQYEALVADAIFVLAFGVVLIPFFQASQNILRLKEKQYKALVSDVMLLIFGLALVPLFQGLQSTRKLRQDVCHRCGHEWRPRSLERAIRVCPKCKSPYWDRPRRRKLDE